MKTIQTRAKRRARFTSHPWLLAAAWAGSIAAQIPAWADEPIPARLVRVQAGEDLALAHRIDAALADLSGPVTQCVEAGGASEACQCRSLPAVVRLQDTVADTLRRRPAWDAPDVVLYWETSDKEHPVISHNVALRATVRALDATRKLCAGHPPR